LKKDYLALLKGAAIGIIIVSDRTGFLRGEDVFHDCVKLQEGRGIQCGESIYGLWYGTFCGVLNDGRLWTNNRAGYGTPSAEKISVSFAIVILSLSSF
jgi:hypothetical protein